MDLMMVLQLFGGIALFLFGMNLMGKALKKVAGNRLELILYRLSNTTLKGVLLGTGVTAVIQSSSATSVMVVGFVNSGMMKMKQAVSVTLGAILGTSITGWIICLNYIDGGGGIGNLLSSKSITCIVALIGVIFVMFLKKPVYHSIGEIMMGFAILMFGMSTMSTAVSSLGDAEGFRNILMTLSNPLLGVLIGAVFTAILQSASAAVGIIQALSMSGTITFAGAVPLLIGVSIGASVPVLLSALGASVSGKRAALIYPLSTLLSAMGFASIFYIGDALFHYSFLEMSADPFSIALVNTILRLAMVMLLLPFCDAIEALATYLVREKEGERDDSPLLEEIFISHPALAVDQSRNAMTEMADKSKEALISATGLIGDFRREEFEKVEKLESSIDKYEDSLGTYLVKLTGRELTHSQNSDISVFLHTLSDFERISDHALNIAESAKEIKEKRLVFSESAKKEMRILSDAVNEIVIMTIDAFISKDTDAAKNVEPLEELIDGLCDKSKINHIERLQRGECTIQLGFVLNDLLTNFERVSDHCSNIAAAMIEIESDEFDTHKYLGGIKNKRGPEFEAKLEEYSRRYDF